METLANAFCLAICHQIARGLERADVITVPDGARGMRFEIRRDGQTLLRLWQRDGHLRSYPTGDDGLRQEPTPHPPPQDALLDVLAWLRDGAVDDS